MLLTNGSEGLSKNVVDGVLTAFYGADFHETVTHEGSFLKVNDLDILLRLFNQVVGLQESLNITFDFLVNHLENVSLPGEDISDEELEEGLVLSDELGQVHISQGT